ncbi:MAG: DUF1211 domain-containing protein [Bacteroidia bacterium]|nr:DUF1211 domain-containing protein [Bacteroidia bacterium]
MTIRKKTLPINRIEALSDGIFAIAMTILVLNISIPEKETVKQIGLHQALLRQVNEFIIYFLSFFLLGIFWMIQRKQMSNLIQTDNKHMWMTIFMLMFICLVPFSASLQSTYANDWMAALIFSSNMLIIGILFLLNWHYATTNHRLVSKDISREDILLGKANTWSFILVSIVAMVAALVIPEYSGLLFLLIPISKILIQRFFGIHSNKHQ